MSEVLPASELPEHFDYPAEFLRVIRLNLVDLEPWVILEGQHLLERHRGLTTRYPTRRLVPFAHRTDRDDIACWDLDLGLAQVSVIDDFEVPGYEQGETYPTFYGWLRSAVDDFIEFDRERPSVRQATAHEMVLRRDHVSPAEQPSEAWPAVVAAEHRFTEAVLALPHDELPGTLSWALTDFSSRRAALRVLTSAHPQLTSAVLPALQPLLLASHSMLEECRRLILRLPPAERAEFLERLSATVVGDASSDDEAYRRAAELLRTAGAAEPLAILVRAAHLSADPAIAEVGEDFA